MNQKTLGYYLTKEQATLSASSFTSRPHEKHPCLIAQLFKPSRKGSSLDEHLL
jgi:hypothetical protein